MNEPFSGIDVTTLLQIDSSARFGRSGHDRHGSHTRRMTDHFVRHWLARAPQTEVLVRDVAATPPRPVDDRWIEAAFTPADHRTAEMAAILRESDQLVDELERADLIVVGAPMYNFGVPSPLKAWIDNVVRVGRTFGFDRGRPGAPYWPLLAPGKKLIVLSARGDGGYGAGGPLEAANLVDASIRVPLAYVGVTDFRSIAAEWDEFADARVRESLKSAEADIEGLVTQLAPSRPRVDPQLILAQAIHADP
ncbi:FMN-dependent NADH-azoreductase [Brevundimonas sp.]|uniref:FMN-dependent NADH-azoreductase n=1 Tax=Brevundimonas sp. TaxID=1871086 RepID=UPI002D4FED6E|nr:NAD(P)H-dependent oxidoreductase [Brevundimonas sp.]HYC69254.1 NAD(P)H-dependent oxidoreductase [Brevundimonas sp.]